jgi:predicted dehydrogenase
MKPVRVGFVGLGGICKSKHVPGLRHLPNVEIVAVCNRTRESSEAAAKEMEIPEVCGTWEALVERADLDAVFVGTWPYMHRDVSIRALDAGKHVFCQARLAMNGAEAREMADAAARSGNVAMVCPVPIGLSIDKTIARIRSEGELGDIHLVRVQSFSDAFVDPQTPLTWRKDHRLSGRNMHTLGMYVEVMHRWFGQTLAVSATSQTFVTGRTDASGAQVRVEIPDQFLIHADVEAGFPIQYAMSTAIYGGKDQIEIYGTKGALSYDVWGDTLYRIGDGQPAPVSILPDDAYDVLRWRVEADFITAIREGTEYHPTFEEGRRYMEVIDAVYRAAAEGCLVVVGG